MDTEEMIKVMQAYDEGKSIEYLSFKGNPNEWCECKFPIWNWDDYEYRIKQMPKLKPSDLKGKWLKTKGLSDNRHMIVGYNDQDDVLFINGGWHSLEATARDRVYEDGSEIVL